MRGRPRQYERPAFELGRYEGRRLQHDAMIFSRVCASDKQDEPIGRQPDTLLQAHERVGIMTGEKLFRHAVRDDGNLITG